MTLIEKVKANLILEHDKDDELLEMYIDAAISYAESYQHLKEGYYSENKCLQSLSKLSLCCPLTFMKAVMVVQVASLLIPLLQVSKQEKRLIIFYALIRIGRCRLWDLEKSILL